jgi:hypothetical protein
MKKIICYVILIAILSIYATTTNKDISGSMTTDKQTIYFSAKQKNTFGGYDIYKAEKMEDGNWGKPENLGKEINTPYDEVNPVIDRDNATLYFNVVKGIDTLKYTAVLSDEGFWRDVELVGTPVFTNSLRN